ncbi:MAG: TrkH family potassium uptake protein [Desulfurococcales archaeon]|nr:TrkH family potassium uptake protein [Desulfurococcales archaeon]
MAAAKYLNYVGLMLVVISSTMIVPGIYGTAYSWVTGANEALISLYLLIWGGFTFLLGVLLGKIKSHEELKPYESLVLTVIVWLVIPIYESIPFKEIVNIPFIDALFEVTSGWTTTGLTIFSGQPSSWGGTFVPTVEMLPKTILLWRSMIQWVGGLGIVVFTIAFLAHPGVSVAQLYLAEGKYEKLEPSFKRTAYKMGLIYILITLISTLGFIEAGMPVFDSINHAMTGVATAGFSVKNNSIGEYHSIPIYAAAVLSMVLGAVSFSDLRYLFEFKLRRLVKSVELRTQILIWSLAILTGIYIFKVMGIRHMSVNAIFQVFSASTTCGFQTMNIGHSPSSFVFLLTVLMLLGGSAFSTAGGIKIYRIVIAAKVTANEVKNVFSPIGRLDVIKVGGRIISDDMIKKSLAVIFSYIAAWMVSSIFLAMYYYNMDFSASAFEVASALANTGLTSGISSAAAPIGAKVILILDMLLGRLEVMSYLVIFYMIAEKLK